MSRSLPMFMWVIAFGLVLMLAARLVSSGAWRAPMQWGAAAVLVCGVVLLIMRR